MTKRQKVEIEEQSSEILPSTEDKEVFFEAIVTDTEPSEKPSEAILKVESLSRQANQWKLHLKQLNITPEDYLIRFPGHINKQFIEELF